MDEKVTLYRDINSDKEDGQEPVYKRWFPKTTDECVIITDGEIAEEVTLKTRIEQLKLKIADLEKEASVLSESIGNIKNLPNKMTDIVSAVTKNAEDISQQNSNLATAIYSTDLMSAYDNPTFVRWDENTANTPYKAGLTMNQAGFAFCHGRYSGWQTIVAFLEGSKETFFHYCISGVPSNWLTIFSISKNTLADALHTGNNAGIYKVDSSTLNNPSIAYGMEIILKDASSQWIFTIIIPTNLSAIYFDFYNGYGGSPGWIGWRKCDLVGVS